MVCISWTRLTTLEQQQQKKTPDNSEAEQNSIRSSAVSPSAAQIELCGTYEVENSVYMFNFLFSLVSARLLQLHLHGVTALWERHRLESVCKGSAP